MRIERDLLGKLPVPKNAYWGIGTERARRHFTISGKLFPKEFLLALAKVKKACLLANTELGLIQKTKARAITRALDEIILEKFLEHFPLDVFQSGSGTQINMNMNEVVANRANELLGFSLGTNKPVHPNDDVNKSQSSNDIIPTTMHLVCVEQLKQLLLPTITALEETLTEKIKQFKGIIKVGRTHLQDAVPIPLALEFAVYKEQLLRAKKRLEQVLEELYLLPIGGTVLGTGLNAPSRFVELVLHYLHELTGEPFQANAVKAEGIASHNTLVFLSSILKLLALSLMKMANDIRLLGSGPRAGFGELLLPENEPGSSIMPGKVNPTQAEALIQACQQVIGNDLTVTIAESTSNLLDLQVAKPVTIINLLESITLLAKGMNSFKTFCLKDLKANTSRMERDLEQTLMLITRLVPIIGYDKAGEIAKKAYDTNKTIRELIEELDLELPGELDELLDPKKMV